jgi:hypothetical protein
MAMNNSREHSSLVLLLLFSFFSSSSAAQCSQGLLVGRFAQAGGECYVNATDGMGMWPLLAAVKCHNLAMTILLLDHGATPKTITSTTTSTELHALADRQKGPFPPVRTHTMCVRAQQIVIDSSFMISFLTTHIHPHT